MTQPKYAPIPESAEVRPALRLPAPAPWETHRPADYVSDPRGPRTPNTGIRGPDQGYALRLAEDFGPRLQLTEGEHEADVLAGAVAIGLKRASLVGRAPVATDIEVALRLFGYLTAPSDDQLKARRKAFNGAHHDYWQQRDLADFVPESTLRLPLSELMSRLETDPASWRSLSGLPI